MIKAIKSPAVGLSQSSQDHLELKIEDDVDIQPGSSVQECLTFNYGLISSLVLGYGRMPNWFLGFILSYSSLEESFMSWSDYFINLFVPINEISLTWLIRIYHHQSEVATCLQVT